MQKPIKHISIQSGMILKTWNKIMVFVREVEIPPIRNFSLVTGKI
jgi:hypothetical protein